MSNSDYYIGLMSGTSLDSIDAVLVRFTPSFELCAQFSHPIPGALRQQMMDLTQPGPDEIERLGRVDIALADTLAEATLALLHKAGVPAQSIRAIGSHGQTIRHRPHARFSLQIGDPNTLAERTGITTVADFRRRDLAAGGQGAPLVPAFHQAMFQTCSGDRIIANLGGMANITLLPASPEAPVIGYDTGPANVLMDGWIEYSNGESYDCGGAWAASGCVDDELLRILLAHPFFQAKPPKSTGREDFHLDWIREILSRLPHSPAPENVQATLLELTSVSLSDAIKSHTPMKPDIYLCGGGSHNRQLMARIQHHLPDYQVETTATLGLDVDWVEAAAFAWFAMRTLHQQTSSLPDVTGAQSARILGTICPA